MVTLMFLTWCYGDICIYITAIAIDVSQERSNVLSGAYVFVLNQERMSDKFMIQHTSLLVKCFNAFNGCVRYIKNVFYWVPL